MPALDTHVLVRYVVQDNEAQLTTARRLIRKCVAEGQTLFVPVTVARELEWVLRASFDFADCLHVALVAQAGESPLWTFDKRAAKFSGAQAMGR